MGRALLSSFLADLVDNIKSIITSQTKLSVVKSLHKVMSTLLSLDAVVDYAEEKQFGGGRYAQAVKDWLNEVQDALYQLDEILLQILTTISSLDQHPLLGWQFVRIMKKKVKPGKEFKAQILDTLKNLESLVKVIGVLGLTVEPVTKRWMESSGDLYSTSDVLDNYPKYDFLGRNEEVKTILDYLLSTTTESEQRIKVINIVGFAGVGKTSLVDVIYSNHKVRESFKLRAQITVPYIAMVKNILEEITGNFCGGEDEDFDFLCKILQERCGGKKCLLVLDDIRIEDSLHNWSKLIASFETGAARGSAIILTSIPLYDPKLLMIPATHTVHLSSLSTENCLSIFMGHAWRQTDNVCQPPEELSTVGKKIVNELGSLPLAVKMTGSLLQDKLDLNPQWDKILCEFLDGTNLLPIPSFLVMCYLDLPAPVKRCFAYLSLFPKSYHFRQKEVICQWMAQGFLKNNESGKSMEDTGDAYLGYLIKRSFLQPAFGYNDRFMMHNLVHDLAIYVFGESYKHHLCYDRRMEDFPAKSILKHGRSLRTIMPVYLPTERGNSEFDPEVLQPVIMKLSQHVFRVLSLSHYKITSLPASIGELRHLCYLNVSYTNLKELPDSICDLLNLQTLLLRGCYSLTTLPDRLCNLVNLRHLDFQGSSLQRMPPNMHNLTSLLILTDFIVSDTGPRLGDLAGLSNLKVLAISNLQNVAHANDASDAKLKEKKGLADLWLSWDYVHDNNRYGNEMEVLKKLEPSHKDLKILKVTYYPGARFPKWLGDPSYSALQNLDLYYCENFESLPTLGLLPFLRELYIGRFTKVSSVGLEFYGEITTLQKPFQSLKVLRFSHMPEWKKWNIVEGIEFPHLVHLCILQCPKLVGDLPNELPSLKKLEIIGCTHLVAPLPNVSDTCEVFVHNSHSQPSLDMDTDTVPQKVHEITPVSNSGFEGTSTASEIEEILHGSLMETESVVSRFPFSSSSDTTMSPRPKETSTVMFSHQVEAETGSQSSMAKADIPITTQAAVIPPTNTPSTTAPFNNEEAGNPRSSFEVLKVSTVSQLKSLPPTLHTLKIEGCEYLEAIPNGLLAGLTSLKELYLISCGSLKSLPSLGYVTTLYIRNCRRLENLSSSESKMQVAFLHHLFIGSSCDSLTTLTLDFFPKLKNLCIWDCSNLQSFNVIREIKGDLQSLESLEIRDCPRLMSFPEGGLHAPNLESIFLSNCKNINNLPDAMNSLTSLKTLFLHKCPEIESFPYGGLPSSLVLLSIAYCDKLTPQKNWRLDTLESLNRLELEGGCMDMDSFPEDKILPPNISSLRISTLKSLKKLNYRGFQHLNALHTLEIHCCDVLRSLPDEELPSSLNQLCVQECPLLTPRLKPNSGKEWHKVARIPHIQIDHQIIC